MKTLIALDIDGTLTPHLHSLPDPVVDYLESMVKQGCEVALITGRCYTLAYPTLANLTFPYLLAVHNGAIILEMPEKRIFSKQYIDPKVLPVLDKIVEGEETDYALYTGVENQDLCYYRPHLFSERLRDYAKKRAEICQEQWVEVEQFDELPLHSITSIKFFGDQASAERIQAKIEKELSLHIPVIRDPIDESIFLGQATHPQVDKGTAVRKVKGDHPVRVIAAGDDRNDLPMLLEADIKIVMGTAPQDLQKVADYVAKPATEHGIIEALEYARNNRL